MKIFQIALLLYIALLLVGCAPTEEDVSNSSISPAQTPVLEDTDSKTRWDESASEQMDETTQNIFCEEARVGV